MSIERSAGTIIKILIAEDDREQVIRVKLFLEGISGSNNLKFRWAESAHMDITMMQINSSDLLITDGWMPNEGDGIGLANWTKSTYPDMPIILLTSKPPIDGTENIDVVIKKTPTLCNLRESVIELLKLQRRMF